MRFRRLMAVMFLVAFACPGRSDAAAVPAFAKLQNSLALVVSSIGLGTAFCISSDGRRSVFLTNRHVVGSDLQVRLIVQGETNRILDARVLRVGTGSLDAAVLTVAYPNIPYLTLSRDRPAPGTAIGVAGYPKSQVAFAQMHLGLTPSVHAGTLSASVAGGYYLEFDAQIEPGNSGGPLFDADTGFVYGIITYKVGSRETNLAIAIPETIAFLEHARVWGAGFGSPEPLAEAVPQDDLPASGSPATDCADAEHIENRANAEDTAGDVDAAFKDHQRAAELYEGCANRLTGASIDYYVLRVYEARNLLSVVAAEEENPRLGTFADTLLTIKVLFNGPCAASVSTLQAISRRANVSLMLYEFLDVVDKDDPANAPLQACYESLKQ